MKILGKIGAIVVVLFLIGLARSKNEETPTQMYTRIKSDFDQKNAADVIARPDLLPSQAIAQNSSKMADKMLVNAIDINDKIFIAAAQFNSYYTANIKSRPSICRNVGVDITPFVDAFKKIHLNEHRIAIDAITRQVTPAELLAAEKFVDEQLPLLKQAMEDMAHVNNLTLRELCVGFAQDADFFAVEFSSQKKQPATYAALHGH